MAKAIQVPQFVLRGGGVVSAGRPAPGVEGRMTKSGTATGAAGPASVSAGGLPVDGAADSWNQR